jgi:outer membrane protein assembly factor BamB
MKRFAWLFVLLALGSSFDVATAKDWPTYRGDAQRSGYTDETLPDGLTVQWRFAAKHAPQPAWSDRDTRMPFDRVMHPVVADGRVFFGSSVDCKVYALDAATGNELWTFFCDGPIRFAPAVDGDRLFVVSDDGHLYCLAAADGAMLWKVRGGPTDSKVLGNGRLISRWPARGGPVVADGVVYFAAGIWPSEGIFIYAIDAETGKVVWCNDRSGSTWTAQPHGGANAASGVSAQGYLVVAGDKLLVPTGRAVPAVFDRKTGELLYFHLQKNGHVGGADIVAGDNWFFNGSAAFDLASGTRYASVPKISARLAASCPDSVTLWESGKIHTLSWEEKTTSDRKGTPQTATTLSPLKALDSGPSTSALIVAGGKVVSAGVVPEGYQLDMVDLESGQSCWSTGVEAEPLGLAVADQRLLVATAAGQLVCYGGGDAKRSETSPANQTPVEAVVFENLERHEKCAEEIVRKTGVTEGYCVDLACGDGALAYALAKRTQLRICAFDSAPAVVARARRNLDAAGVYGARVTVFVGDERAVSLPDSLADLVVSGRSVREGGALDASNDAYRIVRPYGGVACLGRPGAMKITTRGPLDDAGTWTHQYCDPTNSNCSDDTIVQGPLGVLWFNDFAFPVPSRHGRGRAPLFLDGRMFVQGMDAVLCVNAYNGRELWEYPLPGIQKVYDGEHLMGVSGTGGNYCVGPTGLYVHTGAECLRIDSVTGELLASFKAPVQPDGKPGTWGIVALEGDTLFGTLADTRHLVTYRYQKGDMNQQYTESMGLFAMDAVTGDVRWDYEPEHTIRHNTIAIGNGRVHLIDRPTAVGDRQREKRVGVPNPEDKHAPGRLVTLNATNGQELWQVSDDVYGTMLALSAEHDILLMCYQDWRFKLASELGGRMAAFDGATGKRRWDIAASYKTRPIINGRTIYLQPDKWDLLTGEHKDFVRDRSYGCGIPSGCTNMLVYRSAVVGYIDLLHDYGTENYGGIRPGCWINAIPAGGLVLMPDATDRCKCSYLNKASIALAPYGVRPPKITPNGASRREPFEVQLASDSEDAEIRYTLDGSSPTIDSPRYTGPLKIEDATNLRARVFADHLPPSTVASAEFSVDPSIIPLDDSGWKVMDRPGGNPPVSDWQLTGDYITERSNLFVGVASNLDPDVDRPGSYRVFEPGKSWSDGELALEISSSDDDGLGVAFRFNGPENYYVWSMDRQRSFHILGKKQGDGYATLAKNTATYEKNRWYEVRVVLDGPKVTVYVDGVKDLEAVDETFSDGTIGLYSWGCAGAKFRNVRWAPK